MNDFIPGGERPRASVTTLANFIVMVVAVLTLGGGAALTLVSITTAVADIRADVKVLQMQVGDLRAQVTEVRGDVREVVRAVRDQKNGAAH